MSSGTGLRDWLIQRATALYMAFYLLGLACFFITTPHISFEHWHDFMGQSWVQISTFIALVSIGLHGWVGMWTIATDYIKPTYLRLGFLGLILALLLSYFAWGIKILWG